MAYQKVTKGTTLATASAMQKALDGASIGLFKTVQGQQGNRDVLIMLAINIRSKTGLDGVTLYNCFMLATEEGKELATSGSDVETLLNNCEGRYIDFSSTGSLTIGSGASATTWQLYLSIDTIDPVNNTTITRAAIPQPGWTETIGVSMSARDSFAAQVMQGLVGRIAEPLRIEQSTWKYMTQLSYNIAEYMLVESVKRKAAAHDEDPDTSGSGGSGEEQGDSEVTRSSVDVTNGTNNEKLLNNIVKAVDDLTAQVTAIKTSLQGTIKIDNPANDTFKVEGDGGSNINKILEYNATPRKACSSYIGFWLDSEKNKWFVGENTVDSLTAQIEAAQLVAANNSPYLWLRKSGNTVINDISTFLSVYSQDIYNDQAPNWRADIKTALVTALNKLDVDNADVDATNAIAAVNALWV